MRHVLFLIIVSWLCPVQTEDVFKQQREAMVKEQIQNRGVKNAAVLNAMRKVPRHKFVPSGSISEAYDDGPLPIGYGQTISQPYIVAYMTEIIKPGPEQRVLEIGTGSGYQAAVLSEIVKEVYTIEIVDALSKQATSRLTGLNYKNVHVKSDDGYYGWEEHAPFDAIVVTAAAEHIPPPLIGQLKEGGKMIVPVGTPFMVQKLMLVEKSGGKTRTTELIPVRFVPFKRK
jgi:protein-L-isoaspartate(D-aspartate) O-methyltransferase